MTSNCETCPLLKKAPYVCNACPKREAIVDTRNSSTTKELSLIMKLSSPRFENRCCPKQRRILSHGRDCLFCHPKKDNTSTTSSHQMNCRLQELLSTDTLKKAIFPTKPIDFPCVVKFRKRRIQKPPTNS